MADDVWSHGGPRVGCALAGGHSCEGAELALGFSVHGVAKREKLMKKGRYETRPSSGLSPNLSARARCLLQICVRKLREDG